MKCLKFKTAGEHNLMGDPSLLENMFLNLGINASHAMPDSGTITIETKTLALDQSYCDASSFDIIPGCYLQVEVRDTGIGIAAEDLPRIFEPFFTTKGAGGTGLGLAAIFGTVQQHNGAIHVKSEVGVGTTFQVLLLLAEGAELRTPELKRRVLQQGVGRILIIDDEESILVTTKAILERLGYEVIVAGNGRIGFDVFQKEHDRLNLVILDMIMPELNGRQCLAKIRKIDPDIPVILASGFSQEDELKEMRTEGIDGFIRKPFLAADLSQLISDLI